ncbi:MAG: branched-chain amino acid ABC transporter permease [bacterium]
MKKTFIWIVRILILAFIILFPSLFGIYYGNILVGFTIFALYCVTVNLLLGYTGLLSFGQGLYFGMGAYATALALTHIDGFPLIPSLLVGMLAAGLSALILCPLLVRVKDSAFAMLTLAFAMLIHIVCLKLRVFTGGEDGVGGFGVPPFRIPGLITVDLNNSVNFYYFVIIVIGASLWALWFFTRTPFGAIMVSIRDNALRVDFMGFKVLHAKAVIITVSGVFAGLAGSLYALFQNVVAADGVFGIMRSFDPLIATVVGGTGSIMGPIYGAGLLTIMDTVADRFTERIGLVFGLTLVITVMIAPTGIVGAIQKVKAMFSRKEEMA